MQVDSAQGRDSVDRAGSAQQAQQVQQHSPAAEQAEAAPHDHAARANERQRTFVSHHMGQAAMRARLEGYMAAEEPAQPAAEVIRAEPGLFDRVSGWASEQADNARAAAGRIRAGASAIAGRVSDGVSRGLQQAADGVDQAADRVREGAEQLARGASEAVETLEQGGQQLVEHGERALRAAGDAAREIGEDAAETVRSGLEQAQQGAEQVLETGRQVLDTVREYGDVESRAAELEPGESMHYEVGGGAQIEARVEGQGSVDMARGEDVPAGSNGQPPAHPDYSVTISGRAAVGVSPSLGASAGGRAEAEARAMVGAGAQVELHFDNPQDAARAAQIAARAGAVGAAAAAGSGLGPSGSLVAGGLAEAAVGPSADDLSFMADHTRSVELRLQESGQLSAGLGAGLDQDQLRLAGLEGRVGAEGAVGVRFTMAHDGEPAQVTVFGEGSVSGRAGIGLGLNELEQNAAGHTEPGTGFGTGIGAEGEARVRGRIEYTMNLPENVDTAALLRDPQGQARQLAAEAVSSGRARLTLTAEAQGSVSGVGRGSEGIESTVTVSGTGEEIGAAWRETRENGVGSGLRSLGDHTEVEVRTERTRSRGIGLAPAAKIMGVGLDAHVAAERREKREVGEPRRMTGTEAAEALGGAVRAEDLLNAS